MDLGAHLIDTYAYDAWGKVTNRTGNTVQPFSYTGREDDGTGLYNYRARYYEPSIGRFTQQDPIGLKGGDSNIYRYVGNNSTNLVDPLGLFFTPDTVLDVTFVGIDVYNIVSNNIIGNENNLGENLASLGGDLLGAAIPGLTGVGAGIKIIKNSDNILKAGENVRIIKNPEIVYKHLEKNHGIDPVDASKRLHDIKKNAGRGPADNVLLDLTGGVYDPKTGDRLGSLTEGGSRRNKKAVIIPGLLNGRAGSTPGDCKD
jgi:RHS repeat-associated protein